MPRPRIGLFGGTFDPPHLGHVAALRAAAATGRFDRIEVTVAGDPYRKTAQRDVRPAPERLALAQAAFGEIPLVEVSDRELRRAGPSYTIDTVRELLLDALSVDVLIGADVAEEIEQWHEARALADLVKVGIFPRPGSPIAFPPHFLCYEITMPPVDLSSTEVRSLDSESLPAAVPPEIVSLLHPDLG